MNADELSLTPRPLQPEPQDVIRIRISELAMAEKLRVMWGWFWRGAIVSGSAIVFATIIAAIIGFAGTVGFIIMKVEKTIYMPFLQLVGFLIGLVTGFVSLFFLIRWLTKAKIGSYEFWLVRSEKTRQ
ncbi:MAG: hypothetical protein WC291_05095 [Thermodesulfovibrionales bacterium]|jgi:hypothetical protein